MDEILFFHKGGRAERRDLIAAGEAPADFFYGTLELEKRGYDIEDISTATPYAGPLARWHRLREMAWSQPTRLGLRLRLVRLLQPKLDAARVAMSITDGFSASLGFHYRHRPGPRPYLIGCFHALSDVEAKCHSLLRPWAASVTRRALEGLDHIACFGPADREFAIARYGLDPDRISVLAFGVDTRFWHPDPDGQAQTGFLSIGSDPNRDFATLCKVRSPLPFKLLTRLPVEPGPDSGIELLRGSYWNSSFDDRAVRAMYHKALAVVVPLKDVFQPTGYSVTLQAMACGKPVVLSAIKGLWAPDLLRHEENCLLVPPGDVGAIQAALERLAGDSGLRECLGRNARALIEAHFDIAAAARGTEALIRQGLEARTGAAR